MRTKTLLLTAALAAAGAASAMAQNVYSVNAVGYINKTIGQNYNLLANPFKVANESLDALMPSPGNGTVVYKPSGGSFEIRTYDSSIPGWDPDGAVTINLGDGVICYNPGAPFTVTFVGEVSQSVGGAPITNPVHAGQSIKSSKVSQAGPISASLGFTPTANVVAYQYDATGLAFQSPNSYAVADGFWDPAEPTLGYADAIILDSAGEQSWDRVFTVN